MDKPYVLALDQGTTSSRAILFDREAKVVALAQQPFAQIYPQPGWVEHEPMALWETQLGVAREALAKAGVHAGQVAAIGLTNQRETTLVWERDTGKPLGLVCSQARARIGQNGPHAPDALETVGRSRCDQRQHGSLSLSGPRIGCDREGLPPLATPSRQQLLQRPFLEACDPGVGTPHFQECLAQAG